LDIYVECNGVNMKILDAWDGEQLKLAFWCIFNDKHIYLCYDVLELLREIELSKEMDYLDWQFENKIIYSSSSLHHVVNFKGVLYMFLLFLLFCNLSSP
jgi:hypothetical protein